MHVDPGPDTPSSVEPGAPSSARPPKQTWAATLIDTAISSGHGSIGTAAETATGSATGTTTAIATSTATTAGPGTGTGTGAGASAATRGTVSSAGIGPGSPVNEAHPDRRAIPAPRTAAPSASTAAAGDGIARQPWPWSSLLLLSSAVFVSVTTELLPTGLLPAMSRDLAVSEGRLGLLVTAYALMVAVLAAPIGMMTSRIGRRSLLTAALVGYAVCNAVTAISGTYALTVSGRLIGGLSHGLFWGMLAGYAGRLVGPDRVGRAVTIASAGGTAAVLLGVPAGTALGVAVGWRAAFAGFAVVSVALAGLGFRLLPRVPGTSRESAMRMRDVLRLPGLAVVVIATGVIMLGHFSFITYVAPYLTHAGVTETRLAPALLAYGAAGLVGIVLAGILVDRRLRGAIVAATILLAATFTGLAIGGRGPAVAVGGLALIGVALGMLPVFLQAATLRAAPTAGDPASALNASTFNIGIGGGALLGGLTLDHWGATALPIVAAALTGLGLLAVVISRRVGALATG